MTAGQSQEPASPTHPSRHHGPGRDGSSRRFLIPTEEERRADDAALLNLADVFRHLNEFRII